MNSLPYMTAKMLLTVVGTFRQHQLLVFWGEWTTITASRGRDHGSSFFLSFFDSFESDESNFPTHGARPSNTRLPRIARIVHQKEIGRQPQVETHTPAPTHSKLEKGLEDTVRTPGRQTEWSNTQVKTSNFRFFRATWFRNGQMQ